MDRTMLKSKIHGVRVTGSNLNYMGSLTIDEEIMIKADLIEHEQIHVFNINSGDRFITYVIKGKPGSGEILLNGAAARLGEVGDKLIIVSFAQMDSMDSISFQPRIIFTNEKNMVLAQGK